MTAEALFGAINLAFGLGSLSNTHAMSGSHKNGQNNTKNTGTEPVNGN